MCRRSAPVPGAEASRVPAMAVSLIIQASVDTSRNQSAWLLFGSLDRREAAYSAAEDNEGVYQGVPIRARRSSKAMSKRRARSDVLYQLSASVGIVLLAARLPSFKRRLASSFRTGGRTRLRPLDSRKSKPPLTRVSGGCANYPVECRYYRGVAGVTTR